MGIHAAPSVRAATSLHWILRAGCALCYLGHGAFGVITKSAWVPYFAVVGIPEPLAWRLMPIIGAVDITMAAIVAIRPCRAVLLYMTLWSLWTALLRPLAGEPFWETLERAGNFGVPLAFLLLAGPGHSLRAWIARIHPAPIHPRRADAVHWALRLTTGLLLIGHAGFGAFVGKPMLREHYAAIGLDRLGVDLGTIVASLGWFELLLAVAIIIRPGRSLLILAFIWKLASELLYPLSGAPVWEFIERAGSYAAPLALLFLHGRARRRPT